jgi:hypothetical protein
MGYRLRSTGNIFLTHLNRNPLNPLKTTDMALISTVVEISIANIGADIDNYAVLCLFIHFFRVDNCSFGEP